MRKGISLVEVIIGVAMVVMLFGGIFTAYISILDAIQNSEMRSVAASVLNQKIEIVRNLPYDSVGVVGGIPSGVLKAQENVTSTTGVIFVVDTTVRNIDDPFDGTLGGNPNDTAPSDYKLVELSISCPNCAARFVPLSITTTVAPKNLESSSSGGSLFINVFNSGGQGVQGASVHITNASVTPAIDLTDVTNANGMLQLVGVPTSSQRYHMVVTKSGYSSEQTYPVGGAGNPNPSKPDATVAAQTLTQLSFSIDQVSTVNVMTKDLTCQSIGNKSFTMVGSKLIGTPSVFKFSTSSMTATNGLKTMSNIEWDTYTLRVSTSSHDIVGMEPIQPFVVNPNTATDALFVLASSSVRSLMVTVKDGTSGAGIEGATVLLSDGSYAKTFTTGHALLTRSSWSGGAYIDQSGMDAESVPGTLTMAGPTYSTSTTAWLISPTIDVGGASSTFYKISWNPSSQPAGTTLSFQIASNNDGATWNYIGPDGTGGTYYTTSDSIISATHNGNRYLRYKTFMQTTNGSVTPSLDDVSIEFNGPCVPSSQTYFTGMSAGAFTVTVNAPGYNQATSSVTIVNGWQEATVALSH